MLARSRLYSSSPTTQEISGHTHNDAAITISSTDDKKLLQQQQQQQHPKLKVSIAQIMEQFEQLKPEQVAQDLLVEDEMEDEDVKEAEQLAQWFQGLSEELQEEFTELWKKPHVRFAANEISADPRVYRRYINSKDVVRYIEITGIKPWESMPTTDEEYPVSSVQDMPTKWVGMTGREKKEIDLGGPKAMFPEKFRRNLTIGEWGTFQDPVLIPTTLKERIVECGGYCVPSTKGISRAWTMRVNEIGVCHRCLQVFLCFDASVYQEKSNDNETVEHKLDDDDDDDEKHTENEHKSHDEDQSDSEHNDPIEPVKYPADIAREFEAQRRREDKEVVHRQIAKQMAKSEHRRGVLAGLKAVWNSKNSEQAQEASRQLKTVLHTPLEERIKDVLERGDIDENANSKGFSLWLARRRAAKREVEDKETIREFFEEVAQDEKVNQDRSRTSKY